MFPDQIFLESTLKLIAEFPEEVRVERTIDEKGVLLTVHANKVDYGKIIGREGSMARSLRTILNSIGLSRGAFIRMWLDEESYMPKREYYNVEEVDISI